METRIDILDGENDFTKIYVLSSKVVSKNIYEITRQKKRFLEWETKVLELCIEGDLRGFLRSKGVIPYDGTQKALEKALVELETKGVSIEIRDRYYDCPNEKIVGVSPNEMTVILEGDTLSCAMEVEYVYGKAD